MRTRAFPDATDAADVDSAAGKVKAVLLFLCLLELVDHPCTPFTYRRRDDSRCVSLQLELSLAPSGTPDRLNLCRLQACGARQIVGPLPTHKILPRLPPPQAGLDVEGGRLSLRGGDLAENVVCTRRSFS